MSSVDAEATKGTTILHVRHRTRPASAGRGALPIGGSGNALVQDVRPGADTAGSDPAAAGTPEPLRTGDYEVGYGKPPKHSQFRKGQCGNPKGRPRRSKSAQTVACELLNKKMKVKVDGKTMTLTALEVSLQQQLKKAMTGDPKALQFLLAHIPREADPDAAADAARGMEPVQLDDTERAMLADHQRNVLSAQGLDEAVIAAVLAGLGLVESGERQA